jgi:hypothetical protein
MVGPRFEQMFMKDQVGLIQHTPFFLTSSDLLGSCKRGHRVEREAEGFLSNKKLTSKNSHNHTLQWNLYTNSQSAGAKKRLSHAMEAVDLWDTQGSSSIWINRRLTSVHIVACLL